METRMNDMLTRYGECVNKVTAAKILSCCDDTVRKMLNDGRLRSCCKGTMVDVRSIVEYIEAPAEMNHKARMQGKRGNARYYV